MFEYNTIINGLPVEAKYSNQFVNNIAIPLLKELTQIQIEKGSRVIAYIAAPPGAGKSTLTEFITKLSATTDGVKNVTGIGMDGFHRYQDYLLTHTTMRDGKQINMVDIKGAPITFDLEALESRIKSLLTDEVVPWPTYNRLTHNPEEGAITVDGDIVLIEGNYLLLDEPGWKELSGLADYTISISADPNMLRTRLVNRKIASGATPEAAEKFVDFSDMANVMICTEKMKDADLKLLLNSDGDYTIH